VTEGEHRWLGCERREDHRDDDGNVVHAELVDSLYERVRAASGDIALEITDTDHGSRDFTARPGGKPVGVWHLPSAGRR
jgi:hypothetical protein